jgi:hypothetical protein
MDAMIELIGEDLLCRVHAGAAPEWRIKGAAAIKTLQDWCSRYDTAVQQSDAVPMKDSYRATYLSVLSAFSRSQTQSRLLLTSRYKFTLLNSEGRDLARQLSHVHLLPMTSVEQRKQWHARIRSIDSTRTREIDATLVTRAIAAADGNPGLQSALLTPLLSNERAVTEKALAARRKNSRSMSALGMCTRRPTPGGYRPVCDCRRLWRRCDA